MARLRPILGLVAPLLLVCPALARASDGPGDRAFKARVDRETRRLAQVMRRVETGRQQHYELGDPRLARAVVKRRLTCFFCVESARSPQSRTGHGAVGGLAGLRSPAIDSPYTR
jgi:hypothetical protein